MFDASFQVCMCPLEYLKLFQLMQFFQEKTRTLLCIRLFFIKSALSFFLLMVVKQLFCYNYLHACQFKDDCPALYVLYFALGFDLNCYG